MRFATLETSLVKQLVAAWQVTSMSTAKMSQSHFCGCLCTVDFYTGTEPPGKTRVLLVLGKCPACVIPGKASTDSVKAVSLVLPQAALAAKMQLSTARLRQTGCFARLSYDALSNGNSSLLGWLSHPSLGTADIFRNINSLVCIIIHSLYFNENSMNFMIFHYYSYSSFHYYFTTFHHFHSKRLHQNVPPSSTSLSWWPCTTALPLRARPQGSDCFGRSCGASSAAWGSELTMIQSVHILVYNICSRC